MAIYKIQTEMLFLTGPVLGVVVVAVSPGLALGHRPRSDAGGSGEQAVTLGAEPANPFLWALGQVSGAMTRCVSKGPSQAPDPSRSVALGRVRLGLPTRLAGGAENLVWFGEHQRGTSTCERPTEPSHSFIHPFTHSCVRSVPSEH